MPFQMNATVNQILIYKYLEMFVTDFMYVYSNLKYFN